MQNGTDGARFTFLVTSIGTPAPENFRPLVPPRVARAGAGNKKRDVRLVETLAWRSVAESTQKNCWGKWKI